MFSSLLQVCLTEKDTHFIYVKKKIPNKKMQKKNLSCYVDFACVDNGKI